MKKEKISGWIYSLLLFLTPYSGISKESLYDLDLLLAQSQDIWTEIDEDIGSELVFKRSVIAAIDVAQDMNSAIGFDVLDPIQRKTIVIPAYLGSVYLAHKGMRGTSWGVRKLTPEKRQRLKAQAKENTSFVEKLSVDEQKLGAVENELKRLEQELTEVDKRIAENRPKITAGVAPESATAKSTSQTAPEGAVAQEQVAKTTKAQAATSASSEQLSYSQWEKAVHERGIQSPREYQAKWKDIPGAPRNPSVIYKEQWPDSGWKGVLGERGAVASRPAVSAPESAVAPEQATKTLTQQRNDLVREIQQKKGEMAGLQNSSRNLSQRIFDKFMAKRKHFFYRVGRIARGLGLGTINIAGIAAIAVMTADVIVIEFSFEDDLQDVRDQFEEDIADIYRATVGSSPLLD